MSQLSIAGSGNESQPSTTSLDETDIGASIPLASHLGLKHPHSVMWADAYSDASTMPAYLCEAARRRTKVLPPDPFRTGHDPGLRRRGERESYICSMCGLIFGRISDKQRHCNYIHRLKPEHYHCNSPGCRHQTRRLDRLKAHCRRTHCQGKGYEQTVKILDKDASMSGCPFASCRDFPRSRLAFG